jgi:uncharacterized glyoxalase superfamily protein PhnB
MLHVPDVAKTADWYESLGFAVRDRAVDGDEVVFAVIAIGAGELLLNPGGVPSSAFRREADLYVNVDDVDAMFERLSPMVEVVEAPHDTFYGAREFIIRDCNRFWITFGKPLARRD